MNDRPNGVCRSCRGSYTQHVIDPTGGCECPRCLDGELMGTPRCRSFDPVPVDVKRKRGRPETLTGPTDSDTQRAGAAAALPNAGTRRREAYDMIEQTGGRGVTFDELVAAAGRTYSQIGPRVRELVRDGHVRRCGTRPGESGADQDVWVATIHAQPTQEAML